MHNSLPEYVVCPKCHHGLQQQPEDLLCSHCQRVFPIVDGIPVMLLDHATELNPAE